MRRALCSLAVAVLVLTALGAIAALVYETNRENLPRLGLPAFSNEKAQALSSKIRASLEAELFEEISSWQTTSSRYPTPDAPFRREQRWRQMADQGFDLAHVTLQVLQPDGGYVYPLGPAMARLQHLAVTGNAGAMCLAIDLVAQARKRSEVLTHLPEAISLLRRGAALGHPECLLQLGRRQILGIDGVHQSPLEGVQREMQARRLGYAHDLDGLIAYFRSKWSDNPADLTRLYCWLSVEAHHKGGDRQARMLDVLRLEADRLASKNLAALSRRLASSNFQLSTCAAMGAGHLAS